MDGYDEEIMSSRSIVDFSVRYSAGADKKGNPQVVEEIITLIVPHLGNMALDYIQKYCSHKNMQLIRWSLEGSLNGKSHFEFACENCNEISIDLSPVAERRFCSKFCKRARGL